MQKPVGIEFSITEGKLTFSCKGVMVTIDKFVISNYDTLTAMLSPYQQELLFNMLANNRR